MQLHSITVQWLIDSEQLHRNLTRWKWNGGPLRGPTSCWPSPRGHPAMALRWRRQFWGRSNISRSHDRSRLQVCGRRWRIQERFRQGGKTRFGTSVGRYILRSEESKRWSQERHWTQSRRIYPSRIQRRRQSGWVWDGWILRETRRRISGTRNRIWLRIIVKFALLWNNYQNTVCNYKDSAKQFVDVIAHAFNILDRFKHQ